MVKRSIILVTPPDRPHSPIKHYELLYNLLRRQGYEIHPFTFANVFRYHNRAIWHIHWIDLFHQGIIQRTKIRRRSAIISFLRVVYFLAALTMSKLGGVKIIWTIHNVSAHDCTGSCFETFVTKILLRSADKVTALNTHIRNTVSTRYGCRDISLMRQGLYERCYTNTITREQARQYLGLSEKDFVLLFLGSVAEYKGIDIAIEALALLQDDSIKLLIAGPLDRASSYGARVARLAEKSENTVLCERYVPDDEVQVYFNAADYTIYPYRSIDNSGPLYLTLAFGVPTIMRNAGGVSEVLNINPNVWVPISDLNAHNVALAIEEARRRKVDNSEFEIFKEKLSWGKLEKEIMECFEGLQE